VDLLLFRDRNSQVVAVHMFLLACHEQKLFGRRRRGILKPADWAEIVI
jgi:hypothetical protein